MMYCPHCGSPLAAGARFCSSCGAAVAPQAGGPGATAPGQPRPTPAFLTGDWAGAVVTTLLGVGAMLLLATVAVVVLNSQNSAEIAARNILGDAFQLTALAAGGSIGDGDTTSTFRPLGLTVVGYWLVAWVFVRRLRRAGLRTASAVGLQAGRIAAVHLGALLVVCVLSRIENDDPSRADIVPTLIWGTVTLGIALFVAWLLGIAGALPDRVEYYRGLLAGPVRSILFLIVISSVVAAGFVVLLYATESVADTGPLAQRLQLAGLDAGGDLGDVWRALLATLLLFLPAIAGWSLLLGMGVPSTGSGSFDGSVNVLDLTDGNDALWLWPVGAIALLVATGYYSARRSPLAANGRPVGWWLAGVLPVALVVLALSSSFSLETSRGRGPSVDTSLGFDVLLVILLGAAYGLGAGLLGSVLVPRQPVPTAGPPAFPTPQGAPGVPGHQAGFPPAQAPPPMGPPSAFGGPPAPRNRPPAPPGQP